MQLYGFSVALSIHHLFEGGTPAVQLKQVVGQSRIYYLLPF